MPCFQIGMPEVFELYTRGLESGQSGLLELALTCNFKQVRIYWAVDRYCNMQGESLLRAFAWESLFEFELSFVWDKSRPELPMRDLILKLSNSTWERPCGNSRNAPTSASKALSTRTEVVGGLCPTSSSRRRAHVSSGANFPGSTDL